MRNRSLRIACWLVVLVSATHGLPAYADYVIEEYEGERPADADEILDPILEKLQAHGYATRPGFVAQVIQGLPLKDSNPKIDLTKVTQEIDLGRLKTRREEKHEEAIAILTNALRDLHENPVRAALTIDTRQWATKGLAMLAYAHRARAKDGTNDQFASEAIAEHVRSFPDSGIDKGEYGPGLVAFYSEKRAALEAKRRGILTIAVSRVDARIFVNEIERGKRGEWKREVPPGVYRIVVIAAGQARRYRIEIPPGGVSMLEIDWNTDLAFVQSSNWIGLQWPVANAAHHRERGEFLLRVARENPRDKTVVLSIAPGKVRHVTVRVYDRRSATYLEGAAAEIKPGESSHVAPIVEFVRNRSVAGLVPVSKAWLHEEAPSAPPSRIRTWMALGVGLTAVGAGAFAGGDNRAVGLGLIGAGGAGLALSIYWLVRDSDAPAERRLAVTPSEGGATLWAGWSF